MGLLDSIKAAMGLVQKQDIEVFIAASKKDDRAEVLQKHQCPSCHIHLDDGVLEQNFFVCPNCGYHFRITVQERIKYLIDVGTFQETASQVYSVNPIGFPGYEAKILEARTSSGLNEAVVTGLGEVRGRKAVFAFMSFKFMGGSMGSVVGEKIARAILLGAERGLPVVLFATSGGARMQEGIFSLMQMAKTSAAIAQLEVAGQALIVVLTDPTYGGVTASFASLGDVILAEPRAMIGFAGPRVIEGTIRQKLPEGFQRSEFLLEKGFVDAIVNRKELPEKLAFIIDAHQGRVKP